MSQALILNRAAAPVWSTTNTGMAFMALAMLLLPVGDTFAKILTGVMGPVEVTRWRLLAQGLCLLPIVVLLRHRLRGAMFSPIIALSGLLVMITLTSLITAFSVMPIATAIAIFFAEPLILTLLAGPLLGLAEQRPAARGGPVRGRGAASGLAQGVGVHRLPPGRAGR